ncbi:G-type lectin S-receptor-like serine/threonine-protein kinase LECRK3 [Tanacetum coccineum]
MAIVQLWLIFLTIFLHGVVAQHSFLSVGTSLTATPDVKPWLSSSGEFALGFQKPQGNDNYLLSIWYDKIPDKTIIWYPKDGPVVSTGSTVELIDGRGLVLSDPQGREVWSSSSTSNFTAGAMNDTGNFLLLDSNSKKVWDSFDYPADTLLPTQSLKTDGLLINSKMSETNFSGGRFQLGIQPSDGSLVLNTRDDISGLASNAYKVLVRGEDFNSTNTGSQLIFDAMGYLYLLTRNGQISYLAPRNVVPPGDYYHRATMGSNGVFTQYYYPKNLTRNARWNVLWYEPENICGTIDSGACGLNNVCSLDYSKPKCECPPGFSLLDLNNPNGHCKPDFTPSCDEGYRQDQLDFHELTNIDWPLNDYAHMSSINEQRCKTSCLEDCFCAVAIFRDNQCWKKALPLFNGKKDTSLNVKALLKFQKGDKPYKSPIFSGENENLKSLIVVVSITFGFVTVALIGVICVGFFLIYKKKARNPYLSSIAVDTNLPHFMYEELVEATNGFKDELGKGAFGIVYKGVIGTKTVAVKKLDRVLQDGEKEFQTEVNAIARTHHKNLVQLLGYSKDGNQRLLIYEYMSNGTLAMFLFGDMRPCWKQRSCISVGIAKGLSYLHEECSTQVMHCDIKPQNILLDEYYNAKISDFGLAKLLMINQSRTSTGIRGTKGYVAPEWFRNTLVTVKVDVYSFGVLLLEIISCRKSLHFESGNQDKAILTDWAWDCYQDGKLDAFVENDLEALDDYKRLKAFVMAAIWCVQETPSLRPTMRKVIQMLEGSVEVTEPPCPFPASVSLI